MHGRREIRRIKKPPPASFSPIQPIQDPYAKFPEINNLQDFLDVAKEFFKQNMAKPKTMDFDPHEYDLLRTLGTGAFGRVMLAKHKKLRILYAVKMMEKVSIVKSKQIKHLLSERNIMQSIRFPFLVYLEGSWKDNIYVFLAMPFICGGEMFTHLRKMGRFDENLSKFYAAQVCLGIEYLHYLDVLYRDLKPENIMIDIQGFIKIADLGFAKVVKGRTWTMCGTPEYISPEIILSKGYGRSCDWWSFGILIYEMTAGYPPFHASDPMAIYEKIVACRYRFASHFSSEMRDIISKLLQVDLSRRYGILKNGVKDIKSHPWFRDINWLAVLNRRVTPPFVPKIKNVEDLSHFERFDEKPFQKSDVEKFADEFADF